MVVAPVVEECGKFLVVYWFVFRRPVFDEPIDGIVYAVTAALGFAALENVVYLFAAYSETLALPLELSVLRAVLSVPGHALMSSMWGYSLGQSLVTPHPLVRRLIWHGLAARDPPARRVQLPGRGRRGRRDRAHPGARPGHVGARDPPDHQDPARERPAGIK